MLPNSEHRIIDFAHKPDTVARSRMQCQIALVTEHNIYVNSCSGPHAWIPGLDPKLGPDCSPSPVSVTGHGHRPEHYTGSKSDI